MNKQTNIARALMIAALAVTPVAALATSAHAEDMRVAVGDLSKADGALAFKARLTQASRALCSGISPVDLARADSCKAAVREEALAQLSSVQLAQLENHDRGVAMASNRH